MKLLFSVCVLACAFCVVVQPATARMKPVAAGKVESATERRERVLKERNDAKKAQEKAEREARQKQEKAEREARERAARAEREARLQQQRLEREEREARDARARAENERAAAAAAAAEREEEQRRERAREQEAARLQEEQLRQQRELEEAVTFAGLDAGWKNLRGLVRVDETLQLKRPMVVFIRDDEARRYLIWARTDGEAASQYALDRIRKHEAYLLQKGAKIVVSYCAEEDEEDCDPHETLFYVTATDGTEGWVANPILRQHRSRGRKASGRK